MMLEQETGARAMPSEPWLSQGITLSEGVLRLAAKARLTDIAEHPDVRASHSLLSQVLQEASAGIPNIASLVSDLFQPVRCPYLAGPRCNKRVPQSGCAAASGINAGHAIFGTSAHCAAAHPSELAVALVALGAIAKVVGPSGERDLPVDELFREPGAAPHREHNLHPGETIAAIEIPTSRVRPCTRYLRLADRTSFGETLASAAVVLTLQDGVIATIRVAAGGVGTTPWRLKACETVLLGRAPGPEAWERAAEVAVEGAQPLSGNRYKVRLLRQIVLRCLEMTGQPEEAADTKADSRALVRDTRRAHMQSGSPAVGRIVHCTPSSMLVTAARSGSGR